MSYNARQSYQALRPLIDELYLRLAQAPPSFTVAATFVYRPGGVAYRNVFVTWTSLMAAVGALDPDSVKIVVFDSSIQTCHITAAATAWGVNNFKCYNANPSTVADETIVIDDGATLSFKELELHNGLLLQNASTRPVVVVTDASGL